MSEPELLGEHDAMPLAALVESVLFVTDAPVSVTDLSRVLGVGRPQVESALAELSSACIARGIRVQRTDGHVRLVSAPEAAWAIESFLGLESSARLSRAALETLSIVAYRQPVTRPEIEAVRGVDCDGVLRTLLAKGLVEAVGQRLTVGHPIEYGTSFLFLEYFGLSSLEDLPPLAPSLAADVAAGPPSNGRRAGHAAGRGNGHADSHGAAEPSD